MNWQLAGRGAAVCDIFLDISVKQRKWLILHQLFHKLKNIVKFYKEFILGIIERIKLKMSPFCHFCDQKRELNVLWYTTYDWCVFQLIKFLVPENRIICNVVLYIKITLSSLFWSKGIKSWNFQFDSFNNNKYKFLNYVIKLHYVFFLTFGKTETKLVNASCAQRV